MTAEHLWGACGLGVGVLLAVVGMIVAIAVDDYLERRKNGGKCKR